MNRQTEGEQSLSSSEVFSFADELTIDASSIVEVTVAVNPLTHFGALGAAFARDIRRRDVDLYQVLDSQMKEDPILKQGLDNPTMESCLIKYAQDCVRIRLESITDEGCRFWRKVKNLLLPATIQAAISSLGKYFDEDTGTLLNPVLAEGVDKTYSPEFLLRVASYLKSTERLGVRLYERAFPTSRYCDSQVMLCALKLRRETDSERQVFCVSKLVHPNSAFIAYLLDLTSDDPGRYAVPYGYESRLQELLWRYL